MIWSWWTKCLFKKDEPNERRKKNDQMIAERKKDQMNEVQWEKSRVGEKTGKIQKKKKQQHNLQYLQMSNSHTGQGHMDVYRYSHPSLEATKLSLLHNTANTTS
jgi:hypothetical protein